MEENIETKVDKDKIEKYDRQLRLWGAHGQNALEHAHICLLHANATGTEILKNLVLPGIGSFTIIDANKVEAKDLGNNFFVDVDHVGKSRAKVTTELLQELNEWVRGAYKEEDPLALIEKDIDSFAKYSLVIACDIPQTPLLKLAKYLYQKHIPFVVARAYGFLGYLRWAVPEHTIVESKPEEVREDLRLTCPFSSLKTYASSINIDSLDSHLRSHVPFTVLLLQQNERWRAAHDGKLPSTREEKTAYKDQVQKLAKSDENNFQEAFAQAYHGWTEYALDENVEAVINDEQAEKPNHKSSSFWILAHAAKKFYHDEKTLPLMGSIPDMTADTNSYMTLSSVYQDKAKSDLEAITKTVKNTLKELGRNENEIDAEEIKIFCKNATMLRVLKIRSLEDEYNPETAKNELIDENLDDPSDSTVWYVMLRAADRFHHKHGRYPGDADKHIEADFNLLKHELEELKKENKWERCPSDDAVKEICRYGACEMHNLAAIIGGIGAQEIIKVVTHQWVPLNNTIIFNGMSCASTTLEL